MKEIKQVFSPLEKQELRIIYQKEGEKRKVLSGSLSEAKEMLDTINNFNLE